MDQNKCDTINKRDWACMLLFFVLSLIYGKLRASDGNIIAPKLEGVLPWLICILLLMAAVFILKKENRSIQQFWLFSGIFVLLQYVGVYWCERLCGFYDIAVHNILFHRVLANPLFLIPYMAFLVYVLVTQTGEKRERFTRLDGVLFALLLLPLLVRTVNLFLYGDIVDTVKGTGVSVIAGHFLPDTMRAADRMAKAEDLMDMLMRANLYLEYIYRVAVYAVIVWGGIGLWKGNVSYHKYFALGGTFLAVQYFGIVYFDKLLRCIREFSDSSINLLYRVMMSEGYAVVYILIPIICVFVRVLKKRMGEKLQV